MIFANLLLLRLQRSPASTQLTIMNTTMRTTTTTMTIITILTVERGTDFRVSSTGSTALVDVESPSPAVILLSLAIVPVSSGSVVGTVIMSIVVVVGRGVEVGTEVERRVVVGIGVAERVRGVLVKVENISMDEVITLSSKMVVVSIPVFSIDEEFTGSIVALVNVGRSVVTD